MFLIVFINRPTSTILLQVRVLKTPLGNALLVMPAVLPPLRVQYITDHREIGDGALWSQVGVGGSGRKSLATLAAFVAEQAWV